ncbi:hypothetical protein [Niallia taxi]|uniref:hypothetical protein n=1 Tax=Niallia taxi TaxID=2499688 RepID=UPI00300A29FF
MTHVQMKQWVQDNLLMQEEAMVITNQSVPGFNQSVRAGAIIPFVEYGTKRKTRLYLKSDLEQYAKNKRKR